MKKLLAIFSALLFISGGSLFAQQQVLFGGDVSFGGFGAVSLKLTSINESLGVLSGGFGALSINRSFYIGGGGWALVNEIPLKDEFQLDPQRTLNTNLAYGGLIIGYVHNSDALVHWGGHLLVGGGAVGTRTDIGQQGGIHFESTNPIFALEPELFVQLNVATFMKLNLGGGYRIISGNVPESIVGVNMPYIHLNMRFGGNF